MTKLYRIEHFKSRTWFMRRTQYYFRITSMVNGKIIAQSEGYNNRADRNEITKKLYEHGIHEIYDPELFPNL